jgi:hypothetical protein
MERYQILPGVALIVTICAHDPPAVRKPSFLINEEPEACNQMSDEDDRSKNKKSLPQ